jgi:hypothetical protein
MAALNKDELFWMFHHEHNKYRKRQNKPRHMGERVESAKTKNRQIAETKTDK